MIRISLISRIEERLYALIRGSNTLSNHVNESYAHYRCTLYFSLSDTHNDLNNDTLNSYRLSNASSRLPFINFVRVCWWRKSSQTEKLSSKLLRNYGWTFSSLILVNLFDERFRGEREMPRNAAKCREIPCPACNFRTNLVKSLDTFHFDRDNDRAIWNLKFVQMQERYSYMQVGALSGSIPRIWS